MQISLAKKISIMIIIMIVLSTSAIGFFGYYIYRNDSISQSARAALDVTIALASSIDAEEFTEALDNNEKTEYWYETKAVFDRVLEEVEATYLYAVDSRHDGVDITYFLEGALPFEDDAIDLGEKEGVEYYDETFFTAIETGEATTTDVYDAGEFGILVGGLAPILDSNNNVVGIVGMDTSLDNVLAAADDFALKTFLAIIAFNVFFLIIALRLIDKWLGKPLKSLSRASEKIGCGDMDVEINSVQNDEVGLLSKNLKIVAESISGLISDISQMSAEQSAGNIDAFIRPDKFEGAYKDVALGINRMVEEFYRDQGEFQSLMTDFGSGNFDAALRQFPGKKARLNTTAEELRKNLKDVSMEISSLAESALKGDLSKQIDLSSFSGDWAKIVETLNSLVCTIHTPIDESTRALNKMSKGNLDVRLTGEYSGVFAEIKTALNSMSNEISSYISEIKSTLMYVSAGNLTHKIDRAYLGQFIEIKDSINDIISSLNKLIGEISCAAEQVSIGASQLSESSQYLSKETYNQNMLTQKLSEIMKKIDSGAYSNEQNARNAYDISQTAIEYANSGSNQMQNMLKAMESIQNASNNISHVIKTIETIAFQTNILALNASVEAARAGIHGKGFTVVAEEVGTLAKNTQNAIRETATLIDVSIQCVKEGSLISAQTSESFNKILNVITDIEKLTKGIMTNSEEQVSLITTASQELSEVERSVSTISSTYEETSALSEELSSQAIQLNSLIKRFELS